MVVGLCPTAASPYEPNHSTILLSEALLNTAYIELLEKKETSHLSSCYLLRASRPISSSFLKAHRTRTGFQSSKMSTGTMSEHGRSTFSWMKTG